jgi:hypothetical protein
MRQDARSTPPKPFLPLFLFEKIIKIFRERKREREREVKRKGRE